MAAAARLIERTRLARRGARTYGLGEVHDLAGVGVHGDGARHGLQIPLVAVARDLRAFAAETAHTKQTQPLQQQTHHASSQNPHKNARRSMYM